MKLSLCMIVRDNEETLVPCLESIKPWVDEMIIVDTGSVDRTMDIVKEFGGKLFEFPWCDDFSAARNVSLDHASGEWLFWMDSDDTITAECGQRLRELADSNHDPRIMGYVMQVHCPGGSESGMEEHTVVDHVKMFRNREDLRFEGRIHEQVLMPIRRLGGEIAATDIYVVHSGSDRSEESQKAKVERDMRILKKDLEERPDHPFVLFNFAMTYAESHEYEKAIEWCKKCLEHSTPNESHVPKTYAYLANCLLQLERAEESLEVCKNARQLYPNDAELLFREAMSFQAIDNHSEAISCYKQILDLETPESLRSTDPGITGFKCRFNLGVAYRDAKMDLHAERQWRQVLDECPSYIPAQLALTEILIANRRLQTSRVLAKRWQESEESRLIGLLLEAQVTELDGETSEANRLYKKCIDLAPDDSTILEKCCRFYFENDPAIAAELLERLIACDSGNAAAYHNLGSIRLQQNQREQAIDLLRKSLNLRPDYHPTLSLLAIAESEA